jgi:murein L,D-transpeptidase YafK
MRPRVKISEMLDPVAGTIPTLQNSSNIRSMRFMGVRIPLFRSAMALILSVSVGLGQSAFLSEQLKHEHVRVAKAEKDSLLRELFQSKGVAYPPAALFIRVFKLEKQLELWGSNKAGGKFTLIKSYPICATSGDLGPKRREGDMQIPEGFYHIGVFNPTSAYYLSLGIDYPNRSDRILGKKRKLGGAIMIHGDCVTIGCIPIQDKGIKEVYWACLQTRSVTGRDIPVHIFPSRMDAPGMADLQERWRNDSFRLTFWENLNAGFLFFDEKKILPSVGVDDSGRYIFH